MHGVDCALCKHCHHFYDNQTGVKDNSAAHFSWCLKLYNTTFLKAALLEGTAVQGFYLRMLSHITVLMAPRNWQEHSTFCRNQPSKTIKALRYIRASRMPQSNQGQNSQQWLLTRFSQAKSINTPELYSYFRYQIRRPGSLSLWYN